MFSLIFNADSEFSCFYGVQSRADILWSMLQKDHFLLFACSSYMEAARRAQFRTKCPSLVLPVLHIVHGFLKCRFVKSETRCERKAVTFLSLQLSDGKTKLRKINAALKKNFRFQVDQWLQYACCNTV